MSNINEAFKKYDPTKLKFPFVEQHEARRVLITGSRNWYGGKIIRRELLLCQNCDTVIHGACRGADSWADVIAKELLIDRLPFPAKWTEYGKVLIYLPPHICPILGIFHNSLLR